MFKIVEKPSKHQRTFKTWSGCVEYMRLLSCQKRSYTLYENKDGKWTLAD